MGKATLEHGPASRPSEGGRLQPGCPSVVSSTFLRWRNPFLQGDTWGGVPRGLPAIEHSTPPDLALTLAFQMPTGRRSRGPWGKVERWASSVLRLWCHPALGSDRACAACPKPASSPTWTTGPQLPRRCLSLEKGSMLKPRGPQQPSGTLEVPQLDLRHTLPAWRRGSPALRPGGQMD